MINFLATHPTDLTHKLFLKSSPCSVFRTQKFPPFPPHRASCRSKLHADVRPDGTRGDPKRGVRPRGAADGPGTRTSPCNISLSPFHRRNIYVFQQETRQTVLPWVAILAPPECPYIPFGVSWRGFAQGGSGSWNSLRNIRPGPPNAKSGNWLNCASSKRDSAWLIYYTLEETKSRCVWIKTGWLFVYLFMLQELSSPSLEAKHGEFRITRIR